MEKKKSKVLYKVGLMLIAMVLVAAVSVSVVRAYLTAMTSTLNNEFYSAYDLDGEIVEENFKQKQADNSFPDVEVPKDPRVLNTSDGGYEMYAGLRLDFYIYCWNDPDGAETGGAYVRVPYAKFNKFVQIIGLPEVKAENADSIGTEHGKLMADEYNKSTAWYEYVVSDDEYAKYYFYNNKLAAYKGASFSGQREDMSSPVFTSVKIRPGLMINANPVTTTSDAEGGASNSVTPAKNFTKADLDKYEKKEGASSEVLDSFSWYDDDVKRTVYNGFKYKILISGYGVNAETVGDIASKEGTTANKTAFTQVLEGLKAIDVPESAEG